MKPHDIPQGVWDAACKLEVNFPGSVRGCIGDVPNLSAVLPIARAILAEREACAVIADENSGPYAFGSMFGEGSEFTAKNIATAIRSRP